MTPAPRARHLALLLTALSAGMACASAHGGLEVAAPSSAGPGTTIAETLERSIVLLEHYDCAAFAVDFLSPIRQAEIPDLDAYRQERSCSPDDRGNLDDVLLALKLARYAEPELHGVRAVIDLSGIGIRITRLELVRYIDGRWYFNGF